MKETIVTTLLHVLELAVIILASFLITKIFGLTGEDTKELIAICLYAVAVFARKAPQVPLSDWVNLKK